MGSRDEIARVLAASGGVIARRDHPDLAAGLAHLVRTGQLVAVLPGVYAAPDQAAVPSVRMRATLCRHRDAVLLGAAAAAASFLPQWRVDLVEAAVPHLPRPVAGFAFSRRRIPPELIVHRAGLRYTAPALTAIDLATLTCADAIDIALRTRAATLAEMHEALELTAGRSGHRERPRSSWTPVMSPGRPPSARCTAICA